MLPWTASEIDFRTGGIRLCLIGLALGTSAAGLLAAEPAAAPSALDRLKERSATQRWEETRMQWRNDQAAPAAAELPRIDPLPPKPEFNSALAGPQPAAGASDVGFLKPIMVTAQLQPIPDVASSAVDDAALTIFRPITEIRPTYNYSVLAKNANEYLCPQPKDIPEGMQVSCPDVIPLAASGSTDRYFGDLNFQWCASNLVHKPLYFEDVPLERYGHQIWAPAQPFLSLGKFGVDTLALPYTMALDPVCNDEYALGYYRPGECAPELLYQPPLNAHAGATATGVYTGLFFLFP